MSSHSSSVLRLVRDEADPLPPLGAARDPVELQRRLDSVQAEMETLRAELDILRRRDETFHFHMNRIDEELRLAAKLQQDFLPRSLPQVGRVHFHTLYRPAGYVSGDLYDVCRLDEDHIGFWMTDAVGHGMPAALLTMFIKNAFVTKEILSPGYRLLLPGETLVRLNEAIVEQNLSQATFATAAYGVINTKTFNVQFARAGHPVPLILRADGRVEAPKAEGTLLGIFGNEMFETESFNLAPGDRLILYSDGVEVAFDGSGVHEPHRWRDELLALRHLPTEKMFFDFAGLIDAQVGSVHPKDDLTMISVEVR
jgi:sigma-B regulation protein RsbU (phosphoserine phosphatase)